MKKIIAIAALAAGLGTVAPANAVMLQYTISGADTLSDGQVEYASFRIDSDAAPTDFAEGIGFYFAAVPGTFTYGDTTTTDPQDISFYLDAAHGYDDPTTDPGGLFVGEGDLLGFSGPQLFTGPIDHPTLQTGSFTLIDAFSGSEISLTVQAVPEPASWALMIGGLGVLGGALRVRKTQRVRIGWRSAAA